MESDRVLSGEELEALLGDSDNTAADAGTSGGRYDFASPVAAARLFLPIANGVLDTFAMSLQTALLESLRLELDVDRDGAKVASADEFLASLSDPCLVTLFEASPLPGTAVLALDGTLVHSLVDTYFGGNGRGGPSRARTTLSDTECRMGQRIRDLALAALAEALVEFTEVSCRVIQEEKNPLLIGARHFRGPLIVSELSITLGETAGVARVAVAQNMFEPIRANAAAALRAPEHVDAVDDDRWRSAIDVADIDLRCEMTSIGLSIRDLVELRCGDVIPVDIPERVSLDVAGIPILEGRFGIRKGRRALRVDRVLNPVEEREPSPQSQIQEDSHERVGNG